MARKKLSKPKERLELDTEGNYIPPIDYTPRISPYKFLLIGFLIGILGFFLYTKIMDYNIVLYKPEPTPQFLDVKYGQDDDVNVLSLVNISDMRNLCSCIGCYGCRMNFTIRNEQIEIKNKKQ